MINLKVVVPTPGPLGDDDIQQLDLLAFTMKMSGFCMVTASSRIEAFSLMNERTWFPQNRCRLN
jgi:hypothetical protein